MNRNENIVVKMINFVVGGMIIGHPLLLRLYEYDAGIYDYAWMSSTGSSIDIFLHCKMVFFIACYAALTLLFLALVFSGKLKLTIPKEFILIATYAILSLLSTLTSKFNRFSFSGIFEQFESFWCLIGYVLVIIILYLTIIKTDQYIFFVKAFIIGAAIMGAIGVSQFWGVDIIMSKFVKSLFAPSEYIESLHLTFDRGMVYATLYNPDYVGLYVALLFPILLASIELIKDIRWRIVSIVDIILLFISVIGAEATSGIIGVWISIICYFLTNIKKIFNNKKNALFAMSIILCAILATVGLSKLSWYLRREILANETAVEQIAAEDNISEDIESAEVEYSVNSHETLLNSFIETDEYVEFDYNGNLFKEYLYIENGIAKIAFIDENEAALDYSYDKDSQYYSLLDPRFSGISSVTCRIDEDYIGFITTIDGKEWTFAFGEGPDQKVSYYYYTNFGKLDKSIISDSLLIPESKWSMLNSRGFIWSKTLGLLKDHLLLGTGADSFTLAFPHNDYVAMYKGGYENMIISKPHCLYLQCATQTGVLSLACLLLFYLIFFIKNCKRIFNKNVDHFLTPLQNAFLSGTIGFLVSSIANDSTICVTPIFCIIMGLALALNKKTSL